MNEQTHEVNPLFPEEITPKKETASVPHYRPTWIEIDKAALASNVRHLKKIAGDQVTLMVAVKANAYGHGAVTASRVALANGAEYLAVANMDEALDLRQHEISAPILVLSYVPPEGVREAILQKITLSLYDVSLARVYQRIAGELQQTLTVHLKFDTGMGRLGILPHEIPDLMTVLAQCPSLQVEGIYTHFSTADEDPIYTTVQSANFEAVVQRLKMANMDFRYIHAANSAATLSSASYHFNMVRCGIATYGLNPSDQVRVPAQLRQVMQWKTVIAQVKTLPAGHAVGYGNTYRTASDERIAVLPIGYGDGFRRAPASWREVLVRGQRAPVIGRVSMEKTTINVSHIPDVAIGDEVVLMGVQNGQTITAEDIAQQLGTSNYEVVCSALPRVPRI